MDQDYVEYKAEVDGIWTSGLYWKEESTGQQMGISFYSEYERDKLYHIISIVQEDHREEMGFGLFD